MIIWSMIIYFAIGIVFTNHALYANIPTLEKFKERFRSEPMILSLQLAVSILIWPIPTIFLFSMYWKDRKKSKNIEKMTLEYLNKHPEIADKIDKLIQDMKLDLDEKTK